MGTYRKEWDCCNSVTETDSWEPECCPFCTPTAPAVKHEASELHAAASAFLAYIEAYDFGVPEGMTTHRLRDALKRAAPPIAVQGSELPPLELVQPIYETRRVFVASDEMVDGVRVVCVVIVEPK